MELSTLHEVYERQGPFVSAYLEGGRPTETARTELDLRWRELADRLHADGADAASVRAAGERVAQGPPRRLMTDGLAVIACSDGVVFDAPLRARVGGDRCQWLPVPDLAPYVRAAAGATRQLVAVVDSGGADVAVRDLWGTRLHHVEGQQHPRHKVRAGAWSHKRIQNRVEEVADRNAALVATELAKVAAAVKPATVLLAGEVEARERVHRRLGSSFRDLVTTTDRGGMVRNGHLDPELDEAAEAAGSQAADRTATALAERLGTGLGAGTSVQGLGPVMAALRAAAVDVLVMVAPDADTGRPDETLLAPVAIGRDPLLLAHDRARLQASLADTTPDGSPPAPEAAEVPAETALVRAAAASGAGVELLDPDRTALPAGVDLGDGVAAVLRHPLPAGSVPVSRT